jgi:hypothetical protein
MRITQFAVNQMHFDCFDGAKTRAFSFTFALKCMVQTRTAAHHALLLICTIQAWIALSTASIAR